MADRKIFDIHQWVEERLSEYLDEKLASNERARLETHLRGCDRCRASLESLRWSVSLLKQAPVSVPSRQFTLPVTRFEPRTARPSFGFLRAATALATIFLCVVLGLDLFSSSQFGVPSSAPAPAAQFAAPAPTQNIALAPTSAPAATTAPQAASQPAALPTVTRSVSAGAAEAQNTLSAADQSLKSSATSAAAPPAPRAAITTTIIFPSPSPNATPTATVPTRTVTVQAQARAEPTRGRDVNAEPARNIAPPLRVLEIGLLALAVILGALTIFAGRRK